MNKNENEKNFNNNQNILDDDFFDSFSPSKKITIKKKKINELIINLKQNKEYLSSLLSINNREKLSKLYELILLNLTENNNNYVLSQLELIDILGQYLYDQNEFKSFYRQALPKLFDKFYLQNPKINDNIIQMFNNSIHNRILNIEDYYPHIENISLEEDDDYKVIVLNFFYNQMLNNDNIIYEKIPRNIINIIGNLSHGNNTDIIEISSKLMNIFEKYLNNDNINNEEKKEANNNLKYNNKENDANINEISNISIQNINYDDFMNNESNIYDNNNLNYEKINNNASNNFENNINDNEMVISYNENINISKDNEIRESLSNAKNATENNNKNIYNDKNPKGEEEEEKSPNEITRDIPSVDDIANSLSKIKQINSNKKFNHKNRINRSRKLGVISKNKKENEEKNNADINNNNNNNIASDKKDKEIKIEKKLEKDFSENLGDMNEQVKINNLENVSHINNYDDIPIKGLISNVNNNEDLNLKQIQKSEAKKNIVNIDDIPVKGMISYENEKSNIPQIEQQTKDNNIINIDDLPVKGLIDIKNEDDIKRDNKIIIDIDSMPIKGINSNNNEIEVKDNIESKTLKEEENKNKDNKKENMVIEIDKNIFSDETKKNKKNRINRKFMNKDSKKIKKDPFENFEIKFKEPPKKEELVENKPNEGINNDKVETKKEEVNIKENEEKEKENGIDKEKEKEKEKKKEKDDEIRFESIKLILGEEIVDYISSNKWDEKKQGYELILNLINKDIIESNYINDLYDYIKFKLKDFKETNFNINKEALNIFITICNKGIMPKNLLMPLIMAYSDKIAEIKLKDNIIELISINNKINGPETLIQELIQKLLKKNNPKILIEYSNLFSKILSDESIQNKISSKELIEYSKYMANNNNPQVRTASIQLISILYKLYGTSIKSSIKDIKESTLKIIEAELDKIELSPEHNSNSNDLQNKKAQKCSGGDTMIENMQNKNGLDGKNPQDISKKITKELLKDIDEGKWLEKKEAVEKIEKILVDSNMKILPNGLNELLDLIKSKLSDGNKNLVKILISLLSKLIESLQQNFKNWSKNIALSLIPNLADKNLAIRNECLACFDKWVENVGLETLVIYFPQFLKNDNVESRMEIMKFIEKYNNNFNKNIGEIVYKDLIDPLLLCLQDRTNNVRTKAEEIIKLSFNYVPADLYHKKIKDFKPAIADNLKQIMNKIENSNILEEVKANDNNDKKVNLENLKNSIKKKNNINNKNDKKKEKSENIQNKNINNENDKGLKENNKNNMIVKKDNDIIKNNNLNIKDKKKKENKEIDDKNNNIEEEKFIKVNNIKKQNDKSKILENEAGNEIENGHELKNERKNSKSFNSAHHNSNPDSDSESNKNKYDIKRDNNFENEMKKKKKNNSLKTKNIVNKENKNNIKKENLNEGNIKVNIIQNNINIKEKNQSLISKKKKISNNNNISNNIDNSPTPRKQKQKDNQFDDNNIVSIKQKQINNKNIMSTKTRNNKLLIKNEKNSIISKSSAKKKKLYVGKSKPVIDVVSKKQLLFQEEYNPNTNNINDINFNTQRMFSNSVNIRNNKKEMRRTKSVEKKNIKKKLLPLNQKVFLNNNRLTLNKKKRYELDKKYNFNINTLTKDDFNKIKEISEKLFTEEFIKKILNQDFKKQIEALMDMKQNLDKNEYIQIYLDNFDIMLKLISIKIYNNFNPAVAKALCEFFESVYNIVNEYEYNITDVEINIILALLIEKFQINNVEIKRQVNYLLKFYISLFEINKIVMQILNMSLLSNNKIKAGILEFILDLNENENLNICNNNYIRIFALFLHCNDNDVKIRLFELFKNIYKVIGNELWNLDVISPNEKKYLQNNIFKGQTENENINEDNEINENNDSENNEEINDDLNNNNYEEMSNGEENLEYEEDQALEYKIYPQKMDNLDNNINNGNNNYFYNNNFEKYEKDNLNDNNEIENENEAYIENIGEQNTNNNYNNIESYNDNNPFLKFNESSNNNNTFENKVLDTQNSYSINEKINNTNLNRNSSNINNKSKKLNISNNNKLIKNLPSQNLKKKYNNSLNNYKKNNANLQKIINQRKNKQSAEKNHKIKNNINNINNNKLLSASSSSERIKSEKDLLKIMSNLSSEDESEKLNTIIIVHEILCTKYQENKYILIPYIDNIILIFIKITHNLFDVENIENISAKFAKYLVTILCKIASNKELITHMTYKVLHDLTYELLKYLLISNLDKIGQNQEGNIIFKSLNSAMLRILENCDTTSVILVLLEIIKQNKIKEDDYNLSNLAIKCLIKITQNLNEYINNIQFDKILLQIHLILINYDKYINNNEIKTQTDIMTVKFIKNFIIDVVKIKKHNVLEDYNNSVRNHKIKDNHIFNWIKSTLLMIKNMESNKQIINENISNSSMNKTFPEEYENENNISNQQQYNNSKNIANSNTNEENSNSNYNNNFKTTKKISKGDSKKIKNNKINENKNDIKEDYTSIVERIKILKQNLKENTNNNYTKNNSNLKRKKSIEINKKNKNKK